MLASLGRTPLAAIAPLASISCMFLVVQSLDDWRASPCSLDVVAGSGTSDKASLRVSCSGELRSCWHPDLCLQEGISYYECGSTQEALAGLEAQQRYFSYRAMLVAIVSQNILALVFVGYRKVIARYVAKWGIAQMCLCETKYQGRASRHFGDLLVSLKKYRAIWGIAAILSHYRAIWGH